MISYKQYFDYIKALYRRNSSGVPTVWFIKPSNNTKRLICYHGIVGGKLIQEYINISRSNIDEIISRVNAKRKCGYKYLNEIKDNTQLPVEESLFEYLDTYLPDNRTTSDGNLLPMLAKVYDNNNGKVFNKCPTYIGQWKINGLRCFIRAIRSNNDMFYPVRLQFQSREGTIWNSLGNLEEYLLGVLGMDFIDKMVDEDYILDGELYLPGHTVNEINHFVKDADCKENKLIQFWCYDLAIDGMLQYERSEELLKLPYTKHFINKEEHLNNTDRFVTLPTYEITYSSSAMYARDKFIDLGFEGLILRNPDKEYQYGKRNNSMIKYKRHTDGVFKVVDIIPESSKNPDIPLFVLKNDINDELFKVHLTDTKEEQRRILVVKSAYIHKDAYMFVEYGERSGINQLPFHIKNTKIVYSNNKQYFSNKDK